MGSENTRILYPYQVGLYILSSALTLLAFLILLSSQKYCNFFHAQYSVLNSFAFSFNASE